MPNSLLLDGTTRYEYSNTGSYAGTGAFTMAAIIKSSDAGTFEHIITFADSANGAFGLNNNTPPGIVIYDGTTERNSSLTLADNEWHLVAVTKAAGTAQPRYHRYRYSDADWVHQNDGSTLPNFPTPADIRLFGASSEELEGNFLIGGVWDSELSDAAIEALILTQQAWVEAAPDIAWRTDHANIPLVPFIGAPTWGGRIGSVPTLDTGDAPAGWTDVFSSAILDDFTGADENPITTNWTTPLFAGNGTMRRLSGEMLDSEITFYSNAYYDISTFGPDCEVYATVTAKPASVDDYIALYARLAVGANFDGYELAVFTKAGTDVWRLYEVINEAFNPMGSDMTTEIAAGDSIGLRCIDDQISAWWKAAGNNWVLVGTRTNSTNTVAGYFGVETGGTGTIDNFGGGTISMGPAELQPQIIYHTQGARW